MVYSKSCTVKCSMKLSGIINYPVSTVVSRLLTNWSPIFEILHFSKPMAYFQYAQKTPKI